MMLHPKKLSVTHGRSISRPFIRVATLIKQSGGVFEVKSLTCGMGPGLNTIKVRCLRDTELLMKYTLGDDKGHSGLGHSAGVAVSCVSRA